MHHLASDNCESFDCNAEFVFPINAMSLDSMSFAAKRSASALRCTSMRVCSIMAVSAERAEDAAESDTECGEAG